MHVSLYELLILFLRNFSNILSQRIFNFNIGASNKLSIWPLWMIRRRILGLMWLLNLLMNRLFTWPRSLPLNFFRKTNYFALTIFSLGLNSNINFPDCITTLIFRHFLKNFEKFRLLFLIVKFWILQGWYDDFGINIFPLDRHFTIIVVRLRVFVTEIYGDPAVHLVQINDTLHPPVQVHCDSTDQTLTFHSLSDF